METYLVGGAVRDKLLNLAVKERDWVVVGAEPQTLLDMGYRQVGKDFPVFLHPETREEYALARTERKTAPGYHGFEFHAAPDVTLEDDLRRRDITINAMAETPDGHLVDPFGGYDDLQARVLRHVSEAFAEDPVRILRVARFAARFAHLGFRVADDTRRLMRSMVRAGEVDALVPERVWAETDKALAEPRPAEFFRVLRGCGALARLFPELDRLFGVPQPAQHHPEVDTGVHTLLVLEQAAALSPSPQARFAALVHDLGKGETDPALWPTHHRHEQKTPRLVRQLCERLRAPNAYRDLGVLAGRYHGLCHRAAELRPGKLLALFQHMDALRRPERLEPFLVACVADSRGRPGHQHRPYPQAEYLRGALAAVLAITAKPLVDEGYRGEAVGEALRRRRQRALAAYKREALARLGLK